MTAATLAERGFAMHVGMKLYGAMREFYEDPENARAFEEWKRSKEKEEKRGEE